MTEENKVPSEVEYTIAGCPREMVVEYFRTKDGGYVVVTDGGESLRFSQDGIFPFNAKGSEIKSILHFATAGGITENKVEKWEEELDVALEGCKVVHVYDTEQYQEIKELVRGLLATARAERDAEVVKMLGSVLQQCGGDANIKECQPLIDSLRSLLKDLQAAGSGLGD